MVSGLGLAGGAAGRGAVGEAFSTRWVEKRVPAGVQLYFPWRVGRIAAGAGTWRLAAPSGRCAGGAVGVEILLRLGVGEVGADGAPGLEVQVAFDRQAEGAADGLEFAQG